MFQRVRFWGVLYLCGSGIDPLKFLIWSCYVTMPNLLALAATAEAQRRGYEKFGGAGALLLQVRNAFDTP